jgi:superfamily II DNA or RNA helicase
MTTKPSRQLTLKDRLSRLSYLQVTKMLGEKADRLLALGGQMPIDIDTQVKLTRQQFRLTLPDATVTISLGDRARGRLLVTCSECPGSCEHLGAALSLILEEKLALGLSDLPADQTPLGAMSEEQLVARALSDRRKRAAEEKMRVESTSKESPWTDYVVSNRESGKTYRVALRGFQPGESYCSCPDFRKNTLGTCKHIMRVESVVKKRFTKSALATPYSRQSFSVRIDYGETLSLRLEAPEELTKEQAKIAGPLLGRPVDNVKDLMRRLHRLESAGAETTVYPDAEELIQARLVQERMQRLSSDIRRDPARHPLRTSLLKAALLPYQLDGIAFAAAAGRAILADDMGLGKTIQGIGVAELLSRECGVKKALIVCPASLKSQWKNEITRFSDKRAALVVGTAEERSDQYGGETFFTICNYEQVLRDILPIEQASWDLIILDEGQRIKNWEAKTSRIIKGLRSRFALVLTGTPLENRLDDLFSIVEFIDERRLGPAFRFFNRHRIVNERGKVLGYEGLDELREKLAPVMLRRTRDLVMKELPERTTEIVRIEPTDEQQALHGAHMRLVSMIIHKPYLTEMDMLRLKKELLMCRMTADSTFLVDRDPPGYSSKLDRLKELLSDLAREENRKIVLFSEWTTMLDLIEPMLEKEKLGFVRLDGSVPQKKRQVLVNAFQTDPECKVFITTNAGSTGLNLQAANTVINVDLPWNPAVLEQRVARAHRMGQKSPVQVFVLVTEGTLEENLLSTLSAKHQLALAALDMASDVDEVHIESGMEELKRRLEVLLGAKPDAAVDESEERQVRQAAEALKERKERLALAGGQMLQSAFAFLGEMLPPGEETEYSSKMVDHFKAGLMECIEQDDDGRARLTVTLPDVSVLQSLATTLSRLIPTA